MTYTSIALICRACDLFDIRNPSILLSVGFLVLISSIFIFSYQAHTLKRLKYTTGLQAQIIKQQSQSAKGIITADESERQRIAGNLHDGVGQLLSATRMNLDTLFERLKLTDPENGELADKAMAMVDESCREVRAIAHQMMLDVLLKAGLAPALRDFVNKISSDKLKVTLEMTGLESRLQNNVELVLYRVIQETVNNVLKHANASSLDIQLMRDDIEVSVTIEDNGRGFSTAHMEKFEGIGLKNIITRVAYLKGTVDISSSPGKGTLVAILTPLL